jgi:uncharacterized protein YegP (UPF0339 family)
MITSGEAFLDNKSGKWYFTIQSDNGQILDKSDSIFNSQHEAEQALVELLRGLSARLPSK